MIGLDLRKSLGGNRSKRKRTLQLPIEALETRVLLTSVVVNTTIDAIFPPASGMVSLRNAVATANSSSSPTTITFDPTAFATAQTITMDGIVLALTNTSEPITITGPTSGVTLDANHMSSVLDIHGGVNATISGMIATNGTGTALINNGTLVLSSSTISNSNGSPSAGGLQNNGTAMLTDVTVSGNTAYFGGGIASHGTITLTDVTLSGNTATGQTGVYGPFGAGLYTAGTATLVNVTASGNTGGGGNGVSLFSGTATLSNVTVVGNPGGSGLLNQATQSEFTVVNSIVVESSNGTGGGDASGPFNSLGHNLVGAVGSSSGWNIQDLLGTVASPLNAKLGALANNGGPTQTALPLTASPAVGAGSVLFIPTGITTDQRGLPRTVASTVDIGAVEVQAAAPIIATQPGVQGAVAGNSVSFTASATGNPAPTVQWQISTNGTTYSNISGATSTTYTFTPAVGQNGDLFRAVFSNTKGSATSNSASLTVTAAPAAPSITTQPTTKTVSASQNVSFTAATSGVPAPTVQWQISTDGTTFNNIPGATSATYTFATAAGQNANLLRAVFTNSQGSATTNAATLTVNFAPAITTHPLTQSVPSSQNVSFTAAATGNPAPTVQWQFSTDGTTFNNIAGATSTTYTFAAALAQNGDQFRAVFTNSQSSATTNAATLTVTPTPVAPAITTEPGNQNVTAGTSASFTAAASGSPAPTIRWQVSSDGATFTDIPGATSATYAFTAALGQNGELFRAVFSNSQGAVPTSAASLAVTPAPAAPTITLQPGNQSASAGDSVNFTAAADGFPSPTVQWQVSTDGTTFNNIAGATSTTYTFASSAGQTGNLFRAVFTNSLGSATTNAAMLNPGITVGTTPSPAVLTLGHVTLPTVAVVGVPFNGKVPVTVTNTGGTTLSGNFMLNVYANANPTLDGGQTLIASLKSHFALKPTKARTLTVKVRSLPIGLTLGPYYAVTEVIDPQGGSKTTATGQPFQLNAAVVTLNLAQGNVLPATIPVGKSGSISVTVTNTGNVTASGPLALTLSPSSDGVTPVAGVILAQINSKRVRIAPGKSAKFHLRFKVTAATAVGAYFPYLSVSLAGVTQTAVGSTQFTIG